MFFEQAVQVATPARPPAATPQLVREPAGGRSELGTLVPATPLGRPGAATGSGLTSLVGAPAGRDGGAAAPGLGDLGVLLGELSL